jgi:23S rRNA pseudouridine1911/1915/1917 synthase
MPATRDIGPRKHTVAVPADRAGERVDVCLTHLLAGTSRSRVQAWIETGHVLCNGQRVRRHHNVSTGDVIEVEIPAPEPVDVRPEAIPLEVLFEDRDVIVLNKPAGLVVHPAAGHDGGTLVNALLHHCPDLGGIAGELRPGIVHRLDKDTTGVMIVAKHEAALNHLARQFRDGGVHKDYLALVHGVPLPREGSIETLIGRSRHDRKKMTARPDRGRRAVSRYVVEEVFSGAALLRVRIETGRTHQIRVHMAHIGHPIVGDPQYGSVKRDRALPVRAERQMLHARMLVLQHPGSNACVCFEAPVPADLSAALAALREADSGPALRR